MGTPPDQLLEKKSSHLLPERVAEVEDWSISSRSETPIASWSGLDSRLGSRPRQSLEQSRRRRPSACRICRLGVYYQHAMDSEAFVDAHRRYAAVIHARCRRILRDSEAARDVTQEVFVRCFDRRAQLRAGGDLLAWLYRVATNLCLNQLRRQKTKQAVDAGTDAPQPAWLEKPPVFEVLELLAGLDEETQAIAVYVHVDGMTHQEAAEVAQVSERTVRKRLTRFAEHGRRRAGLTLDADLHGGKA